MVSIRELMCVLKQRSIYMYFLIGTYSFRFKTYLYTPVVDATIFRALRTEENGLVVLGKRLQNFGRGYIVAIYIGDNV